jgi:hypothetical protein
MKRLFGKIMYGEPIIVVSGLPRSGTSMMMKMLTAAGMTVAQDGIRSADEDNPKGYFELEKVKELDKVQEKGWMKDYRGQVVKVISFLLRDLPPDNNYKVIFMLRELEEVLASQKKMLERRNEPADAVDDEKMKKNYDNHLRKVRYMLEREANMDVLYVKYDEVVANPRGEAERVNKFLGGEFDVEKMTAAVDGSLYRNRKES